MATATVKLTAYNMGPEATEADFDNWVEFVNERIDEKCGFSVEVDAYPFARGQASDDISVGPRGGDECRGTIVEALSTLWDDWCSEGAPGAAVG